MKNEIDILKDLISINSVNPFQVIEKNGQFWGVGKEKEIAVYIEGHLKKLGFKIKRQYLVRKAFKDQEGKIISERYNLLAEKGSGPAILFMGHMDTVDVKDGWRSNSFQGTIRGDRMYGLGANDMKAGLAAIIKAVEGINPKGYKIKLAFLVDEEYWSFGAVKLMATDFLRDVKMILVPEIGDMDKKTKKPTILLGRMGRKEYVFKIKGVSDHGAKARVSKIAVNALEESAKLQNFLLKKYIRGSKKEFHSGKIKIQNSAFISQAGGGRGILSIPERAEFILDRSFVPGEKTEKELAVFKKIISEAKAEGLLDKRARVSVEVRKRPTPACEPYFFSPEDKFIKFVTGKVDQLWGGHEFGVGYSVADENRVALFKKPTIVLGPIGDGSHSNQEWVSMKSVKNLSRVYNDIIKSFKKYC